MKKIFFIVLILIILIVGAFLLVPGLSSTPTGITLRTILPFGVTPTPDDTRNGERVESGGGDDVVDDPRENISDRESVVAALALPRLRPISPDPVAGAIALSSVREVEVGVAIETSTGTPQAVVREERAPAVRYVDRATGHIFEAFLDELEVARLSNTTVPKISEALWARNGEYVYLRYQGDQGRIQTFFGTIIPPEVSTAGAVGSLEGRFLPEDITALAVSPNDAALFYTQTQSGEVRGVVAQKDGADPIVIFSSPFGEWHVSWPDDSYILLTTSPSGRVDGFTYTLAPGSGRLEKIIGDISGLSALGNAEDMVLYTATGAQSFTTTRALEAPGGGTLFPFTTFPEKCVWSEREKQVVYCGVPGSIANTVALPDRWYQGAVSFSDTLWRINTETGAAEEIAVPREEAGKELDVVSPSLSPDETHLVFIDKKTSVLWSLRLRDE